MVASDSIALVIRLRGGPNLVVHTRGISGNLVNRACEEAVTIMGRFALGRGQTDVDGSGDIHPRFAHDKLVVLKGRYVVVYRLVFKVWVMAVVPCHETTLVAVRLVEAATKGLVTTCQLLEIDNEVVSRNYQEVYFVMGSTLKYRGANVQKVQAEALANIYSYMADARDKKGKASSDSSKRISQKRCANTKLSEFESGSRDISFHLPEDFRRLRRPGAIPTTNFKAGFETFPSLDKTQSDAAAGAPFSVSDLTMATPSTLKEDPSTTAAPPVFTGLDDLLGDTAPPPTVKTENLFGSFSMPPLIAAEPVPTVSPPKMDSQDWFDFGTPQLIQPMTAVTQPLPPIIPAAQPTNITTPTGPSPLLYLMERWTGTFEGNICTTSEAYGEIGLRKHVWKQASAKSIKFKLIAPVAHSKATKGGVCSAMKCVQCNSTRTQTLKDGLFSAKIQPAPIPYVKYKLLPGDFDAPVRVCVTSAMSSFRDMKRCVILLVQVSTNPHNKSAANGSIYAWLPRPFSPPKYSRPRPQFSKKQNCLRWTFYQMQPNQNILFKAVLPTTGDSDGNVCNRQFVYSVDDDIAKNIRIALYCVGRPGTTFSCVSLSQEMSPGVNSLSNTATACVWSAYVTARP